MLIRYLGRRQYTADDGHPAGGTTPPASSTTPPPADPAKGGSADPPATGDDPDEPVDLSGYRALVDKLRKKEREAEPRLRELSRLQREQQQREREQQTEAQRVQADLEQERTARTTAEQQRDQALGELRAYRVRDAIETIAASPKLPAREGETPQDNPLHGLDVKLAARLLNVNSVELGDDGRPKAASLRRALDALVEEFPQLRAQPTTTTTPRTTPYPVQRAAGGSAPAPAKPDPVAAHVKSKYKPPTAAN